MLQFGAGGNQFHFSLSPHSDNGNKRRGWGNVDYADYWNFYFPHILQQNPSNPGLFYKIAIPGSAAAGNNPKESKITGMIGKPVQAQYIIHIILRNRAKG